MVPLGDSNDPGVQIHLLVLAFCGVYGLMAVLSCIAFGLHIRNAGCVLTRYSVFYFLIILIARILAFGVNAAQQSGYDPAVFHFAEILPELLFFVAFCLILLEWFVLHNRSSVDSCRAEIYYARVERDFGTLQPNTKLPLMIVSSIVIVVMLILWLLTLFMPDSTHLIQWVLYSFTAAVYVALGIAFIVLGRRALSVVTDSSLVSKRLSGVFRSYVLSVAVVVGCGCFFRSALLIGFNLSQFSDGAVAQSFLYSLFYLISEIMPIVAGWVCFRYRLPRPGMTAGPAGIEHESLYLLSSGGPPRNQWSALIDSPNIKKIPEDELYIGECIGTGSFGRVFRGVWRGTTVAVKQLLIEDAHDQAFIADFIREISLLSDLRHPNIVQFLGACVRQSDMCIVTEYMRNGSLFSYLHNTRHPVKLSWDTFINMAVDCAQGMNYLHGCSPVIIHRDLKTANLLVTDDLHVKVADFGISMAKAHTMATQHSTLVGSPSYMAEEVLRNEPDCYTEKCDVFGFGVMLWEMYTQKEPWQGMTAFQVISAVAFERKRLPIPAACPAGLRKLIESCWHARPELRPSFDEVLRTLDRIKLDPAQSSSAK